MIVALVLAAAVATPSTTPTPATAPAKPNAAVATTAATASDKNDPVVCRMIDFPGSSMREKRCLHNSEWSKIARDGDE